MILRPRQQDAILWLADLIQRGHELEVGVSAMPGLGKSLIQQVLATRLVQEGTIRLSVAVSPEIIIEKGLIPEDTITWEFPLYACPPITVDKTRWCALRDEKGGLPGNLALKRALRAGQPEWSHLVTTYQALQQWLGADPDLFPTDMSHVLWFFDEGHHVSELNGNGKVVRAIRDRGGKRCFLSATMFRHTGQILIDTARTPIFTVSMAETMAEPDESRYCPKCLDMRMEAVPDGVGTYSFLAGLLAASGWPKAVIKLPRGNAEVQALKAMQVLKAANPALRVLNLVGTMTDIQQNILKGEQTLKRYADSQVDVILACGRFLEGANWPLCSHFFNLELTNSIVRIIQGAGRGLRDKKTIEGYPKQWEEQAVYTQVLTRHIDDTDFRNAHLDRTFIIATVMSNSREGLDYLRDDLRSIQEMARPRSGHDNPQAWAMLSNSLNLTLEEVKLVLGDIALAQVELSKTGLTPSEWTSARLIERLAKRLDPAELQRARCTLAIIVASKSRVAQDHLRRKMRLLAGSPRCMNWRWVQDNLRSCFDEVVAEFMNVAITDLVTQGNPSALGMVTRVTGLTAQEVTLRLTTVLPWERWFAKLETFCSEHGHVNINPDNPDNRPLAGWLDRQRDAHRHNNLNLDQQAKLARLGVDLVRTWSTADMLTELIRQCQTDPEWIPCLGDALGEVARTLRVHSTDTRRERVAEAVPWFEWDSELAEFRRRLSDTRDQILIPGTLDCLWYEPYHIKYQQGRLDPKFHPYLGELNAAYSQVHRDLTRQRLQHMEQNPPKQLPRDVDALWGPGFLAQRVVPDYLLDHEKDALWSPPFAKVIVAITSGKSFPSLMETTWLARQDPSIPDKSLLAHWWHGLDDHQRNAYRSRL